jgi:hypothetical protein
MVCHLLPESSSEEDGLHGEEGKMGGLLQTSGRGIPEKMEKCASAPWPANKSIANGLSLAA